MLASSLSRTNIRRPLPLRSRLIAIILIAIIPLLVFSFAMVTRLANQERVTFQRGAIERTRALLTAVDVELKSSIDMLEALATSEVLHRGDLRGFYNSAARVLKSQPDWSTINLADPSGQQLINLLRPFGTELPKTVSSEVDQVVRNGIAVIGNLILGPVTQQYDFAVRVPVMVDGTAKYVLSAIIKPETIGKLLERQQLPPNWVGIVLDGNRHYVWRTVNLDRHLGQPAFDDLHTEVERSAEGWFSGRTAEGWDVYTPYARSNFTDWTVAIRIPVSSVEQTFRHSILTVAAFGLAMLVLSIGLAWLFSSRTANEIKAVAGMAQDWGSGKEPAETTNLPTRITEVQTLKESFTNAARLIQERTERLRQVMDRLELAQEAANIGTFERDLITGEMKWSGSQEKLYGLAPGSFSGRYEDWTKLVHPEDIAAVEGAVRRAAETMSLLEVQFRIVRPDGEIRWLVTQARVFPDESGRATRLLGVNLDVTERKRAEAEREQLLALAETARAEAEKANRAKDAFLAILGHELRNPLTVINTSVELLRRIGPPAPQLQELRDTIEHQVELMSHILEDLLDLSRIERGRFRLNVESCDLAKIVRQVAQDHQGRMKENNLRLNLDLPEKPLHALVDRIRLAQIVGNLLQNAIKFTDPGGSVTVTLTPIFDRQKAVLIVSDTGIGIEPHALSRVFEPFVQGEQAIERSHGGLGLGLALVKGLVELHGGTVAVSSGGREQGSQFTLHLPLGTTATVNFGPVANIRQDSGSDYR